MKSLHVNRVPRWVPEDARRYLEHTEKGRSIRHIARLAGCHPSTVMRQVRRVEIMRDDPLIDSMLQILSDAFYRKTSTSSQSLPTPANPMYDAPKHKLLKLLGWLNPGQSVLVYAKEMERAVIICGDREKISVYKGIAGEAALRGWLSCLKSGRVSRYHITDQGRAALSQMMAEQENRARLDREGGFSEAAAKFHVPTSGGSTRLRRSRVYGADTPLTMLGRLTDRNGTRFLTDDLLRAGERLREDFELAQIGEHIEAARESFSEGCSPEASAMGPPTDKAHKRAMDALAALGPGLSDIAIRCCCYLEGLEAAEKQLGWSARSGKIVLRIALQQLKAHYDELEAQEMMIG